MAEEQQKNAIEADFVKVRDWMDEIVELTNTYYEIIPHQKFSRTNMTLLDNTSTVNDAFRMLTDLTDVCVARKIIMAASLDPKNFSPIDYSYIALNIKLDLLPKTSDEYKILTEYAANTSRNSRHTIKRIYRLQRKGEAESVQKFKYLENHYLLWHGSVISNFLGILSQGLRIAPPHAPVSGYSFGKGIYFADMFSKSFSYCKTRHNEPAFMILSEVILGKMHEVCKPEYMEHPPDGFDSVKALGRQGPDFSQSVVLLNGVRIPTGGIVDHPSTSVRKISLADNEYIVYNPAQVRMRYLVELK